MVAIDWVKRIVGIIGSLGNLVWTSLLQSRRRIHHFGGDVGALRGEGGGEKSEWWMADSWWQECKGVGEAV